VALQRDRHLPRAFDHRSDTRNTTPTMSTAIEAEAIVKPSLRGVLHQGAAFVAVAIGAFFVFNAPNPRAMWAGLGFAASLFLLFTVSATYHRVHWQPKQRAWMRRADHASIFVLIAGTYTPVALVGLPPPLGNQLLLLVWSGALVGVLQSLFWINAPKFVAAVLAVGLGWSITLYWTETRAVLLDIEMPGRKLVLRAAPVTFRKFTSTFADSTMTLATSATARATAWWRSVAASAPVSGPSSRTRRRPAHTARTNRALPTPAGPVMSTPRCGLAPSFSRSSGS
jgi:hemolysin III